MTTCILVAILSFIAGAGAVLFVGICKIKYYEVKRGPL